MALPTAVISFSSSFSPTEEIHWRPFSSAAGNIYVISCNDSSNPTELRAQKATDPTSSFSEADASNNPTITGPPYIRSVDVTQVGDSLHIAWSVNDTAGGSIIYYSRFDMSTDTWVNLSGGSRAIAVKSGFNQVLGPKVTLGIGVNSSGHIYIHGPGPAGMDMGSNYDRSYYYKSTDSGVTWSSGTLTDNSGTTSAQHYEAKCCWCDANNRTYMFCGTSSTTWYSRAMSSADSLQSWPSSLGYTPLPYGYSYDDGGTERVRVGINTGGSELAWDSADTPSISANSIGTTYSYPDLQADAANKTSYAFGATSGDLYYRANVDDAGYDASNNDFLVDSATKYRPWIGVVTRSGTTYLAAVFHVSTGYTPNYSLWYYEIEIGGGGGGYYNPGSFFMFFGS